MEDCFVLYADEEQDTARYGNCSPWEAFVKSMNLEGRINLPYMSQLSGISISDLIDALAGKVMWRDHTCYSPLHKEYEGWVTKEQYLGSNIFQMMDEVKELNKKTGLFDDNIELLKSVRPDAPLPDEIEITLGALWVPKQYFEQFLQYISGMDRQPELLHDDYYQKWILEKSGKIENKDRNERYFGTKRMSAVQIFMHIMNVKEIRLTKQVRDYFTGDYKYEYDEEATLAVLEKRDLIITEFKSWLKKHKKIRKELQKIYTKTFGYTICKYDVSILEFPGLNKTVALYRNQKEGIARIILSPNNVLICHSVGAGKTYIFEIGTYECIRMGLYKKAMIVVPNAVFDDAAKTFAYLYPEAEILTIYPDDYNSDKKAALELMKKKENQIILLAESSFNMIDMTKQFYQDQWEEKIYYARKKLASVNSSAERKTLKKQIEKIQKEFDEWKLNFETGVENCFEELGIDFLVVDECHNFKNVTMDYRTNAISGRHGKGSDKADLLVKKCKYVREIGGKLVFASATPISNSLSDLFVLQKYLQPEALELLGISRFHEWLNAFCHQTTDYEVAPNSADLVLKSRFTQFHNLPELMAVLCQVSDYYDIDPEEFELPDFHGYENIVVKKLPEQEDIFQDLLRRSKDVHLGRVKKKQDNMLKITSDGRKAALDPREYDKTIKLLESVPTKAYVCAEKISEIGSVYPDRSQIVFCDTSTPKKGFNVYDELKRQLLRRGYSESQVAFIHDGTTKEKRRRLLHNFNEGVIKVMIGSTQKLGTGVNVQKSIVAVHHLDVPWKPAEMVQREGRAIRQGNTSEEVFVYRYITEGSFDAYMWQILENKQKFIASFLSGTMNHGQRTQEDVGNTVLTYAEVKALAIGNPLIRERVETANLLEKYRISQRTRTKELLELNRILSELPEKMEKHKLRIEETNEDIRHYKVNRAPVPEEDRLEFGDELLYALSCNFMKEKESIFDWYQGFEIVLPAYMKPEKPYVIVRREKGCGEHQVLMEDAKPLGCCMRLDYMLAHLSDRRDRLEKNVNVFKTQQREAKAEIRKGNPYEKLVEETKCRLEAIDQLLKEEKKDE